MATADRDIRIALETRVKDLVLSPALPVVFEGLDGGPSDGGWLDVRLFRNENERLTIAGGDTRRMGFLQIRVMFPLGEGAVEADDVAVEVASHFPDQSKYWYNGTRVRITSEPSIAGGLRDGSWWTVPVTIYYETF